MRNLLFATSFVVVLILSQTALGQEDSLSSTVDTATEVCRTRSEGDRVKFFKCMQRSMEDLHEKTLQEKTEPAEDSVQPSPPKKIKTKLAKVEEKTVEEPQPEVVSSLVVSSGQEVVEEIIIEEEPKPQPTETTEATPAEEQPPPPQKETQGDTVKHVDSPEYLEAKKKLQRSSMMLDDYEYQRQQMREVAVLEKRLFDDPGAPFRPVSREPYHVRFGLGYGLHQQDEVLVLADDGYTQARGDLSHGPGMVISIGYDDPGYILALRTSWMLTQEETDYQGNGNFLTIGPEFLLKTGPIWLGGSVGVYGQSGVVKDGQQVAYENGGYASAEVVSAIYQTDRLVFHLEASTGLCVGKTESSFGRVPYDGDIKVNFCGSLGTGFSLK